MMARRYPFVFIFICTALWICSAYYLHFPYDLRADTEADYLDSLRVFRVHVVEPPVQKPKGVQLSVLLPDYSQQAMLYIRNDTLQTVDSAMQTVPAMGDILLVRTRIMRPQPVFPDDFDYGNYLRLQHKAGVGYVPAGQWQYVGHVPVRTLHACAVRVQQHLVQRYRDAGLSGRSLAFVSAITLGERDALDSNLRQSFAAAGAAHILAVSGLHTGIIYLVVVSLLTCFGRFRPLYEQRLRRVLLVLTILIVLWGYAFVTGLSPSVMRAVVMLTVVQIGWMFRRQSVSLNTLAAAACICLWVEPLSLFNVSFQLSFSAVLGIMLFMPYLNGILKIRGNRLVRWFRDLITVSIAATIGTIPVTLYYFGQVSHYFLLTNIVVLPMAFVLVVLGVVVLLLAHTVIGGWLAVVLQIMSGWVCKYVSWIEHLPYATLQLPATGWMVVCLVASILFCYVSMERKRLMWLVPATISVALFCMIHVSAMRRTDDEQSIVVRGKTLYYRHHGVIEQHPLTGRHIFFRYEGTEYVYAPDLTPHRQRALEIYSASRGIAFWQP